MENLLKTWGKVAVGLRLSKGSIHPMFFYAWTRYLLRGKHPSDLILTPANGLPHSCACNHLILQFLKTDCDSILFIDDDMDFPEDALIRLRADGESFGILSALYVCRIYPHLPVVLNYKANEMHRFTINKEPKGIVECDSVGLGFTLIKRQVIEDVIRLKGGQREIIEWHNSYGEDGQLCVDAKLCGHRIGVNSNVNIGHQVEYTATWDGLNNQTVLNANK